MEQGTTPEKVVEGEQGSKDVQQARLATRRECSLLETYLNSKYGNPLRGRTIEPRVARWSFEQLQKSLKAA